MTLKFWDDTQNWVNDVRDFTDLTGRRFADQTDALFTKGGQYISFTHIPTGTEIRFKAFLKSFNDSFRQQWTPTAGYGRMDDVQTYKGTQRSIQIAFDVPAASIKEAKSNLQKISTFAQMMYPVFDGTMGAQTIKSAPFMKVKFMNWAQSESGGLLGTLSGFSFAPNMGAGVFQTAANKTSKGGKEKISTIYPKMFSISTSLKVMHEIPLGWEKTIIHGNPNAKVTSTTTTTFHSKQTTTFDPRTPTFPYGEKTSSKEYSAASKTQIKDKKVNAELMAANQGRITAAQSRMGESKAPSAVIVNKLKRK